MAKTTNADVLKANPAPWPADAVRRVATADLIPYARNARTHSDAQVDQIVASIRQWGWTIPVLIDEGQGIIAGHGRVMAAKRLGLDEVPCVVATGWSEEQKRAYVLADNQLALNAGWDQEILTGEISDLKSANFDLSLIGFDAAFLKGLSEIASMQGLTDPDAVPDAATVATSQRGDVWLLGPHRLMCGDATSAEDMDRLMAGSVADMWLSDPPYNVDYAGGTKDALKILNDSMSDESFRAFLRDAFRVADAALRRGGVFYIWHADSEGFNFRSACRDIGWQVRQCLIWKKSSMVMGRQDYHWQHEPCLYGWKDGAGHLWSADRKQTTILEFDKPSRNGEHPTMKPVALFEYQLCNNTKTGDVVLDSFGGSGTTIIAAHKTGRAGRVMELSPIYSDVIVKRWQQFAGSAAVLEGDGRTFAEIEKARA